MVAENQAELKVKAEAQAEAKTKAKAEMEQLQKENTQLRQVMHRLSSIADQFMYAQSLVALTSARSSILSIFHHLATNRFYGKRDGKGQKSCS